MSSLATPARRLAVERRHRPIVLAYGTTILLVIIAGIVSPGFDSPSHLASVLELASLLAIVAAGQTLVILTAGIDLSVSYVLNAAGVFLTGLTLGADAALAWVIPVALAGGLLVGAVNGLGIVLIGIPPIIMTLGMNSILEGVALVYTNGSHAGSVPRSLSTVAEGRLFGLLPADVLILLGVLVVVSFLLSYSYLGRWIYALGTNARAARISGVSVGGVTIFVYAASGFFSALTGILLSAFAGNSYLGMGDAYLLPSIAAVVVGGASILGGSGHIVGTVAGAILLTVLTALLTVMNMPEGARDILYGAVILVALLVYGRDSTQGS